MSDRKDASARARSANQTVAIIARRRHRFFQQDVLARLECRAADLGVQEIRQHDVDDV